MSYSKSENKKKRRSPLLVLLLLLLLLSLAVGGVSAYLSMSSGSVSNTLTEAPYPSVSVNNMTVSVQPKGYAVFLRVAVDTALEKTGSSDTVLAVEPVVNVDAIVDPGWKKIGDFYYYPQLITAETVDGTVNLNPIVESKLSGVTTPNGYKLAVHVAAQVIQAIGTTDDGDIPAVVAEWGVTKEQITGTN